MLLCALTFTACDNNDSGELFTDAPVSFTAYDADGNSIQASDGYRRIVYRSAERSIARNPHLRISRFFCTISPTGGATACKIAK